MNILDAIINAQDGAAVRQIGSQLGLDQDQTAAALSALMPALAAGAQRNVREVAARAATQTGLSTDVLEKLLPLAATLMMGAMAKQSGRTLAGAAPGSSGGGIMGMLTPLLDQNRDGSIVDDVTSMIGRAIKRP